MTTARIPIVITRFIYTVYHGKKYEYPVFAKQKPGIKNYLTAFMKKVGNARRAI